MIKPNRIEVNLELPEDELTGMEPLLEAPLCLVTWGPASELEADIGVMLIKSSDALFEVLGLSL